MGPAQPGSPPRGRRGRRLALRAAAAVAALACFAGAASASSAVGGVALPAALAGPAQQVGAFLEGSLSRLNALLRPGPSRDVLEFLFATALFVPTVRQFKTSPIIGFLLMGVVLGPSGLNLFSNVHMTQHLAEFGIIFFLFEMGLELSVDKVLSMKFDVFVLGMAQYLLTGLAVASLAQALDPTLAPGTLVVLGGALALSSSAFVLQLIRDKGQLGTRYGRASFGVLLFQDLAVVPLLVVIPLLVGGGGSLLGPLGEAAGRGGLALAMIFFFGRCLLDPIFMFVTKAKSPEAFLAVTLGTVILCSAITEGLGLSNTLGAFLGGVMLSETHYVHQVEADIAPFRGMLLGLFFTTVGFSIDLRLIASSWTLIAPLILALLAIKTAIVGIACMLARLPKATAVQTAILLAPGGEFAFVVLGLAEKLQLLPTSMMQLLVTATALSMAMTPLLAKVGESIAVSIRTQRGFKSYEGMDREGTMIVKEAAQAKDFVVVCGFGRIGRIICQLLDAEGAHDYIAFDNNPAKAIQARSSGLPVFLADCSRREVLENFKVGSARLVIIAMAKKEEANHVAEAIVRRYPSIPMLVRARDDEHQQYLLRTFGLEAVVPTLPPDSALLSLPFGGEVLRRLGYQEAEVTTLVEEVRRQVYSQGRDAQDAPMQEKSLRDVFDRFDVDGSGEIDAGELRELLLSLGREVTDDEVATLMAEADLDGQGSISFSEFKRMVELKLFSSVQ